MNTKPLDIEVGTRYGRLVTTSKPYLKKRSDGRNRAWVKVRCDCGNEKDVVVFNLKCGNTTSCGCYHKEVVSLADRTKTSSNELERKNHGQSKTPLYKIWKGMIRRCESPVAQNYRWYGGKGITVNPEWKADFLSFKKWAEENGYSYGLQIDRIDTEKNYEADNCRWITKKANIRNRDLYWDNELDAQLIRKSKELGVSPYDFITKAVRDALSAG